MATFLQLAQKVASESGTTADSRPAAVTGQTGRNAKFVRWTNDAWRQIQNAHGNWRWMQAEFYGDTVASQQRYAYDDFNDLASAAAIDRFAAWIYAERVDAADSGISLYDTTVGVADEGPLRFREWDSFFKINLRGSHDEDRPQIFTITPADEIALAPVPDAATYRIRGRYRKDVQELTADGDVPEMPARFHDLIVTVALEMLGTHDESPEQLPLWRLRKMAGFSDLERDQLPRLRIAGPLA